MSALTLFESISLFLVKWSLGDIRTLKSHDSQVTLWYPIWNASALDTSGNRCTKPDPRYPSLLSAKYLTSRITVYSILTVPFFMSTVFMMPELWKFLPDQLNWLQLSSWKYRGDFIQPALGKPDPDPISACRPDTRPDTIFLCTLHPFRRESLEWLPRAGRRSKSHFYPIFHQF